MKRFIFFVLIIIVILFLYGRYIEPNKFKIHEYTIESNSIPNTFKELKIVHFTDILYNKDEKKLDKIINKINETSPDILFFTGDLLGKDFKYAKKDFKLLEEELSKLDVYFYKYAVIGDNDSSYLKEYKDIMEKAGFIILDNKSIPLFYKDEKPIKIVGITNPKDYEEMNDDLEYAYTIVLTHKPDNIKKINNANLVLSGHSLGGIINVPYYGGLIKRSGSKTYINSYYNIDDTKLYISNGIGYEKFEFRLFNNPSINVYRFN